MKLIATALFFSLSAIALAGHDPKPALPETLTCISDNTRNKLEWNEKYGELTISDTRGHVLVSQDALKLGAPQFVDNSFPKAWLTPIVYTDETPTETYATIKQFGKVTQVFVEDENDDFFCE